MFLVGILSWWYSDGLASRLKIIANRLKSSADFFSIGLLFSTLFNPFRQISANETGGSINIQIQSFFDRLLSRTIGAFMRFMMIIIGIIVITLQSISGFIILLFWLVTPLLPIAGLIVATIGAAI